MKEPITLLGLWLLPVLTFLIVRRKAPQKLWRLTGFSFGLVVAPASFGLYGLYFLGPLVGLLGLLAGLPLALFHGEPGFQLAIHFGFIEPRTVVEGVERMHIALLNGVVWSVVYGVIGFGIDWIILKCKKQATPASNS